MLEVIANGDELEVGEMRTSPTA